MTATRRPAAAPTLPPAPAEAAALAAFEGALRREGEPQARLRNTVTVASVTLRGKRAAAPVVAAASLARK